MKSNTIRIKNELPELLEAVCEHDECPIWLRNAIWDAFNEHNQVALFTADYWRSTLAGIQETEESERERSAAKRESDQPQNLGGVQ